MTLAAEPRNGAASSVAGRRPAAHRRWLALGAAVAAVALVGGGWYAGSRVRSPSQAAAKAAPPKASPIGVPVELRKLAQTVIVRGDVKPSVSLSLGVPGSVTGSPVITGVFVKQGDTLIEGQRLVEVSGRPVFVFAGAVPVYRDLKPGMSGADVAQLQAGLGRHGCVADPDGTTYGEATKGCVAKLYADAGYTPVPATATERADLAAADKSVADAQAALDTATLALSKAGTGATGSALLAAQDGVKSAERAFTDAAANGNSAIQRAQTDLAAATVARDNVNNDPNSTQTERDTAAAAVPVAQLALADAKRNAATANASASDALKLAKAQYADLLKAPDTSEQTHAVEVAQAALDAANKAKTDLSASTGATVPQGEIVFVPSFPARIDSQVPGIGPVAQPASGAPGGASTTAGSNLLTVAAGSLRVTARVNVNDRGLLHVGMDVALLDELTNTTYPATLSGLDEAPTVGADQTQGYGVTITTATALPNTLSGANLRVTFTAAATEGEVLVVPLAAVSSGASGQTRVDKLVGDKTVSVTVTAGLSADGFIAVAPTVSGSLTAGDLVVVSAAGGSFASTGAASNAPTATGATPATVAVAPGGATGAPSSAP